jgi:hypothetical protein
MLDSLSETIPYLPPDVCEGLIELTEAFFNLEDIEDLGDPAVTTPVFGVLCTLRQKEFKSSHNSEIFDTVVQTLAETATAWDGEVEHGAMQCCIKTSLICDVSKLSSSYRSRTHRLVKIGDQISGRTQTTVDQ